MCWRNMFVGFNSGTELTNVPPCVVKLDWTLYGPILVPCIVSDHTLTQWHQIDMLACLATPLIAVACILWKETLS